MEETEDISPIRTFTKTQLNEAPPCELKLDWESSLKRKQQMVHKVSISTPTGTTDGGSDEIKSWHPSPTSSPLTSDPNDANQKTKDVVSRLALKLKEGIGIVEQQKKENLDLESALENARLTVNQHNAAAFQREAALVARASTAEDQLADTHGALQSAQGAHRNAVAAAAELQERVKLVERERDTVLQKLESATALLRESCTKTEMMAAEKDAARKDALQARAAANLASARLHEAEALQELHRKKETELAERQSSIEVESLRLRDMLRSIEHREAEAQLVKDRLHAKEQSLDKREAVLSEESSKIAEREAAVQIAVSRTERDRAEIQVLVKDVELRESSLKRKQESIRIERQMLTAEQSKLVREKLAAETVLEKAAEAERAAQNAHERAIYEEKRRQQAELECAEERSALHRLREESAVLSQRVSEMRSTADQEEALHKQRYEELCKAQRDASQRQQDIEESLKVLRAEQAHLDEAHKALKLQEQHFKDAADKAHKEQVVLACARRDSARTAAEMQQRHLDAAAKLEGNDVVTGLFYDALENNNNNGGKEEKNQGLLIEGQVEGNLHRWRSMADLCEPEPSLVHFDTSPLENGPKLLRPCDIQKKKKDIFEFASSTMQ